MATTASRTRPSRPRTSKPAKARAQAARTPKAKPKRLSDYADRFDLYQRAVQCVEAEIDFVDATFTNIRKRKATRLREDFCSTGNTACEWVRRRKGNFAAGLDIDPTPLEWGMKHNASELSARQREMLDLRLGNVLEAQHDDGTFDMVLAMNFSFWCFKSREELRAYFESARRALGPDGVMFLDYYGGSDSYREMTEKRKIPRASKGEPAKTEFKGPFVYQWQQEAYDPITGSAVCNIHFKLPDGSSIRKAFTYAWRIWTLPEIQELLYEAGFENVIVYWEGDDGKGEGDGVFTPAEHGEACPAFIGYISAAK